MKRWFPLAVLASTTALWFAPSACAEDKSDAEIRRLIVAASMAMYSGRCPCPQSMKQDGSPCGSSSAYNKGGGNRPFCYPSNVPADVVERYRSIIAK